MMPREDFDELQHQLTYGPELSSNGLLPLLIPTGQTDIPRMYGYDYRPGQQTYMVPTDDSRMPSNQNQRYFPWFVPTDNRLAPSNTPEYMHSFPMAQPYWFIPGDGTVGVFIDQGVSYFPTDPPPGFDFVNAHFYADLAQLAEDDYDYIECEWFVADPLGSSVLNDIAVQIAQQMTAQGEGTPLALRLYRQQVFNIEVPTQYCMPAFMPLGVGGCHDVPLIGGTTLVQGWKYRIQFLYHNPIPLLVAAAILIVAVVGSLAALAVFDSWTHDKYHLTPSILSAIHDSTPGGAASSVSSTFILMAVAFGIAAIVLPTISQPSLNTELRAGPVRVGVGQAGRAGGRPSGR